MGQNNVGRGFVATQSRIRSREKIMRGVVLNDKEVVVGVRGGVEARHIGD